jgi:hypothetical protein
MEHRQSSCASTSSADSFHTAPPSPMAADTSPLVLDTFCRRRVVPINDDVRQEVTIYFDEELCKTSDRAFLKVKQLSLICIRQQCHRSPHGPDHYRCFFRRPAELHIRPNALSHRVGERTPHPSAPHQSSACSRTGRAPFPIHHVPSESSCNLRPR